MAATKVGFHRPITETGDGGRKVRVIFAEAEVCCASQVILGTADMGEGKLETVSVQ